MTDISQGGVGRKGAKPPRKRPQTRRRVLSDDSRCDVKMLNCNPAKKQAEINIEQIPPQLQPSQSGYVQPSVTPSASSSAHGVQYPDYSYYNYMPPPMDCYTPPSSYHYPYDYNQSYFRALPPPPSISSQPPSQPHMAFRPAAALDHRQEPFFIQFLNGRIKLCYGCKGPHLRSGNGALLSAPNDICIAHKEPRVTLTQVQLTARTVMHTIM